MTRIAVADLALAVLTVIGLSGCLFDPHHYRSDPPPPPPPPMPFPASEDQAIANFKTAYTGMKVDDYGAGLHPQYVFILRPEDVLPGESDRFTCAEELALAAKMFSGLPIERPGDSPVPAIAAISISALERQAAWAEVGSSDPDFANTRRGVYTIQLSFSRAGANTIIVSGQQEFYVTSRDSTVNGVTWPYFQLRGQRDLTIGQKTETFSWGSVKNLYRWVHKQ